MVVRRDADAVTGWPPISRYPHDRIRSATSPDLISFTKEPGVRLQPLADRPDWMAYDPAVWAEGRGWRMLFFESCGKGGSIRSAISADGLDWEREPDEVLLPGWPGAEIAAMTPEPVRSEGVTRLYFTGHGADGRRRVMSALPTEGGKYVPEPGFRIDVSPAWPDGAWSPCLVRVADGRWRMYFSGQRGHRFAIYSALSADGLAFEIEPDERLSPGGPLDRERARHSRVIAGGFGELRMLYVGSNYRHHHARILSAASEDGLHWVREPGIRIDIGGMWDTVGLLSPYAVSIQGGWRVYYTSYWGYHVDFRGWLRLSREARRARRSWSSDDPGT